MPTVDCLKLQGFPTTVSCLTTPQEPFCRDSSHKNMNFLHELEECLLDLAAEARKKHPGVKEASERATLKLRSLQNQYVSAVRKANAASGSNSNNNSSISTAADSDDEQPLPIAVLRYFECVAVPPSPVPKRPEYTKHRVIRMMNSVDVSLMKQLWKL